MKMETDLLLMDDSPTGNAVAHRRSSGGTLGRSSSISRRLVRESSDDELLDVNLPSPDITQTDDRAHGTNTHICTVV